jgi:formamidopyrimidine-DNA glycosylase
MPELPEITSRAAEMQSALPGKTILGIDVLQPKCLNLPADQFNLAISQAHIISVYPRGKWIFVETDRGYVLINMGMGGEILLTTPANLPEKHRLIINFCDQTCLAINFWWFGYVHFAKTEELNQHSMTAKLGPNALELDAQQISALFNGQKTKLKAFLLDQSRIAGIGNAYIHDILFLAGLHPLRPVNRLTPDEIERLVQAIRDGLQPSLNKGGAFYEKNIYGQPGGFSMTDIIIGYKENQPCPHCGAPIEKIKTGSTTSFICPVCQPLV